MRIITGKYKGRTLKTVRDLSVRPATDRVKTTIFNVLQSRLNLHNASVLDLFAGSGSLGFEALSRGAARVVFVDHEDRVLDLIEANAEALGCLAVCQIVCDESTRFLEHADDPFDLIFADPPYAYGEIVALPGQIIEKQLLKRGGFLIIEHARRTVMAGGPGYHVAVQKEFGNTRVTFFTLSES